MNNYRVTFIGTWKIFTTVYPNKIKQVNIWYYLQQNKISYNLFDG